MGRWCNIFFKKYSHVLSSFRFDFTAHASSNCRTMVFYSLGGKKLPAINLGTVSEPDPVMKSNYSKCDIWMTTCRWNFKGNYPISDVTWVWSSGRICGEISLIQFCVVDGKSQRRTTNSLIHMCRLRGTVFISLFLYP